MTKWLATTTLLQPTKTDWRTYAEDGYDCDDNCLNDQDGDGVCDEFE